MSGDGGGPRDGGDVGRDLLPVADPQTLAEDPIWSVNRKASKGWASRSWFCWFVFRTRRSLPAMPQVSVGAASGRRDLQQILDLQARNLESALGTDRAEREGFVTLRHDLELLEAMRASAPQVVAWSERAVIAYALVMPISLGARFPLLEPMFQVLETCRDRKGRTIADRDYFVVGQVCIDRRHRGNSLLGRLYAHMQALMRSRYDLAITELATRNGRSARAHEKVGFELIRRYPDPWGESWDLIGWDWQIERSPYPPSNAPVGT